MKGKLIEIIYVESSSEELINRIKFTSNHVDHFILITKYLIEVDLFENLKQKVKVVYNFTNSSNKSFAENNFQKLFSDLHIDFWDYIIISSSRDYPFIKKNLIVESTKSHPTFHLLVKNVTKEMILGSLTFNYSQYRLRKNDFFQLITQMKKRSHSSNLNVIQGGFYKENTEQSMDSNIIDCFVFNDEIELLKLRLTQLNNLVHKFVLVESRLTHSGLEKELNFEKNKHLFADFLEKIEHVIVDNFPEKIIYSPSEIDVPENLHIHWFRENYQRNEILRGLYNLDLNLEDWILISDVDEIPDSNKLISFLNQIPKDGYGFQNQKWCIWDFDRFHNNWWPGTAAIKWKNLEKTTPQEIRKNRYSENHFRTNDFYGWHCSWFGGVDSVMNKLSSFAHQELREIPREEVERKMAMNLDIHGHQLIFNTNSYKPTI